MKIMVGVRIDEVKGVIKVIVVRRRMVDYLWNGVKLRGILGLFW